MNSATSYPQDIDPRQGMIPKPPEHVSTIDDSQALRAFVDRMHQQHWIALDTEFLRERTYYPKLCLIQIADAHEIGLIDVLSIEDLAPLSALLADPGITKVVHSAEQDLEVLYQRLDILPAPLFDTQIAATLAGYDDQMGYARLIQALLAIDLAKNHTRTDWSQRPLCDAVLDYAADDVRYLAVAYRLLRDKLEALGRTAWLDEECQRLAAPARFDIDATQAWRRLRQWHRLSPEEQPVLAALAEWRERRAMAADRPRKWILGDAAIMELAQRQPADRRALDDIRALPDKTAARRGDALLHHIARGQQAGPAVLAEHPGRPDAQQKQCVRAGMDKLAERAEALAIDSRALSSRKALTRLVMASDHDIRLLHGWRAEAAGREVLAAIEATATEQHQAASDSAPD